MFTIKTIVIIVSLLGVVAVIGGIALIVGALQRKE